MKPKEDQSSEIIRNRILEINGKLRASELLNVSEERWLSQLLLRYLLGEDLKQDLFVSPNGRGDKADRNFNIAHEFYYLRNIGEKDVAKRLATVHDLKGAKQVSAIARKFAKLNRTDLPIPPRLIGLINPT